jgi:hypothetical protein
VLVAFGFKAFLLALQVLHDIHPSIVFVHPQAANTADMEANILP